MDQQSPTAELAIPSDDDLLMRLQDGHSPALAELAFTELMTRYRRIVFAVALRMLRDRGEAEDMVQHVFLEIFRYRADFDPARGTVRTWLLQVAYSRSIERLRYLARRDFYNSPDLAAVPDRLWGTKCPVAVLESRQLVHRALEKLNDRQQRVICLHQLQGHTLREIANHTGESYQAVRHHFYRGMRKMRRELQSLPVKTA